VVTVRIFNQLKQPVASPVALRHPGGEGVRLIQLEYTRPGTYEAFWDGRDTSGRQVASGVYFFQITVNGRTQFLRMFVTK
jgi:flagellar hook assembly protein FlgD